MDPIILRADHTKSLVSNLLEAFSERLADHPTIETAPEDHVHGCTELAYSFLELMPIIPSNLSPHGPEAEFQILKDAQVATAMLLEGLTLVEYLSPCTNEADYDSLHMAFSLADELTEAVPLTQQPHAGTSLQDLVEKLGASSPLSGLITGMSIIVYKAICYLRILEKDEGFTDPNNPISEGYSLPLIERFKERLDALDEAIHQRLTQNPYNHNYIQLRGLPRWWTHSKVEV